MAKASLKPVKVNILLELTEEEAEALLIVCYSIGGSTHVPKRKVFSDSPSSILTALEECGVSLPSDYYLDPSKYKSGKIYINY